MRLTVVTFALIFSPVAHATELPLDERPVRESEWGYRPADGSKCEVNPPNFVWRPQRGISVWQIQCARSASFDSVEYEAIDIEFNVHTPTRELPPGTYVWRYRGLDANGKTTVWSKTRRFTVGTESFAMPMPPREELLRRIPNGHPRLFLRPEDLPRLRELAQGGMQAEYLVLEKHCDRLLANPPPTDEPSKYTVEEVRKSEQWLKKWWGNRTYTINALGGAATLGFTRLLDGNEQYGRLAKRILLDCAEWDPKGSTGYRYNDEAGMPYAYYFSRTYSFVQDLLSEAEREQCRRVMKIRGDEMYRHLCPRHLWTPYSSHSNRAWHFLGEVGIAFHGEIEEADDWVWFAMNVFYNVYPVWCDNDGGWHEGSLYWSSYIDRFTWWADVMRSTFGIDAYDKPYFHRVGDYPMYLLPPGKVGGGFGDLTAQRRSSHNSRLMTVLAAQAGNPTWQWYVEQTGAPVPVGGYIGFVRGTLPKVTPTPPTDLPASRLFRGTGQAFLNTTLEDANQDVQVAFKSSPFGTQSHGYEANNSFLLWAYGQRLLIRSGHRDTYASEHHRRWMWSTRSVNNITVGGAGQLSHSAAAQGRITFFRTTPGLDMVIGEAGESYRTSPDAGHDSRLLDRFTRAILFVKPDLIVVYDRLVARQETKFEYWLHAINKFQIDDEHRIEVRAGDVVCPIDFLAPEAMDLTQTDQYDPNPRERIKLREWHLTAKTAKESKTVEFVTLLRPHRVDQDIPEKAALQQLEGGYLLTADVSGGRVIALLPTDDSAVLKGEGLTTTGAIVVQRLDGQGNVIETVKEDGLPAILRQSQDSQD